MHFKRRLLKRWASRKECMSPISGLELDSFRGPLDLLLYLVRKHELDILDLPIAFITDKYLEYLDLLQGLNLDIASEYLVMAATLAHIKSKMLLPRPPEDQDDEDADLADPRAELILRLLEYQKYKTVASDLGERAIAGRDVFSRGAPPPSADGPPPLKEVSVFKLLDALKRIAERVNASIALEVDADNAEAQDYIKTADRRSKPRPRKKKGAPGAPDVRMVLDDVRDAGRSCDPEKHPALAPTRGEA